MMKINVKTITRKVEVDNRIPLHYYYRIADNLLRQANVYRDEKNIVDLYIMLVRYSSLVSETIPLHRDYKVLHPKEKSIYRKKLLHVLDELEALKPEFQQRVNELNRSNAGQQFVEVDSQERPGITSGTASQDWSSAGRNPNMIMDKQQPASMASTSDWNYKNNQYQMASSNPVQVDKQFQKLTISLPVPKKETLSRHSFLGPTGLQSQWSGPTGLQSQWSGTTSEMKVHYPSGIDFSKEENTCLPQAPLAIRDGNHGASVPGATMESVLSLDDGRWSREECLANEFRENPFQFVSVKQPHPPPVLAEVRQSPIPPSQVADPRPGPAKLSQQTPSSYQHLHVPVNMMEEFLRLARQNTAKNLETCAILAGSLKNRTFHITNLIIPKQESTSDSCQTLNEEEIFEVQDKLSLFPLGWIHTHPSQTCFMSSVDLHTHYSYQIMLPEAIAIVMAPTDTSSPHGIFHLSDPSGVNVIRNCQERGFHPHEEPVDGNPIYEHCSHVFMNSKLKFDIIDLR